MTTLQDLIKDLKNFKILPMVDVPTIEAAIEFASLRLIDEQQQIQNAWTTGWNDRSEDGDYSQHEDGEDYYNKTFN